MLTDADLHYYSVILGRLQKDCGNADLFLLEPKFSSKGPCHRAVKTISCFESCGLLYAPWAHGTNGKLPRKLWLGYLHELLDIDSYFYDSNLYIYWVKYDLCATPLGIEVIDRFNLRNAHESDKSGFQSFCETLFAEGCSN